MVSVQLVQKWPVPSQFVTGLEMYSLGHEGWFAGANCPVRGPSIYCGAASFQSVWPFLVVGLLDHPTIAY